MARITAVLVDAKPTRQSGHAAAQNSDIPLMEDETGAESSKGDFAERGKQEWGLRVL
jgi:hypothetical protein